MNEDLNLPDFGDGVTFDLGPEIPEVSPFTRAYIDRAYDKVNKEGYFTNLLKAVQQGISPETFHRYLGTARQDLESVDSQLSPIEQELGNISPTSVDSSGVRGALDRFRAVSDQVPALPEWKSPRPSESDLLASTLVNAFGGTGQFGASVARAPYDAAQFDAARTNALSQRSFENQLQAYRFGTVVAGQSLRFEQGRYSQAVQQANQDYSQRRQRVLDQIRGLGPARADAVRRIEESTRYYESAKTLADMQRHGSQLGFSPEQVQRDYAAKHFETAPSVDEAVRLGQVLGLSETESRAQFEQSHQGAAQSEWLRSLGQARAAGLDGAKIASMRAAHAARFGVQDEQLQIPDSPYKGSIDLGEISRSNQMVFARNEKMAEFKSRTGRMPNPAEKARLELESQLDVQDHRLKILSFRLQTRGRLSPSEEQIVQAEFAERERIRRLLGGARSQK